MIASTEAEAERMSRETNELSDPEVGRKRLSGRFGGHDFSHLPLDRPLTPEDFPDPETVQAARSRTEVILGGKTLREHYGLSWPKSDFPDAHDVPQRAAE
jgi:hypothetical protein